MVRSRASLAPFDLLRFRAAPRLPGFPGNGGVYLSGGKPVTRVSVFIDYENSRMTAREVFGDPRRDPPTFGNVCPLRLGQLLRQLGEKVDSARVLTSVRVYRGRAGPKSGPGEQGASARQFAVWESQPLVTVRSRPLRYQPTAWSRGRPTRWRAQEKGIDVMMALDIAIGAREDVYDVGVVVSADSDLVPALEVALLSSSLLLQRRKYAGIVTGLEKLKRASRNTMNVGFMYRHFSPRRMWLYRDFYRTQERISTS